MSNQNNGGPAFSRSAGRDGSGAEGMTLRQYAAIKLRVPKSGNEWLDDMILDSLRDELAAKAMQGLLTSVRSDISPDDYATLAYMAADAMLKERDK